MPECQECGAPFTPPPVPECVPEYIARTKWDQALCPECFLRWRAAQDQREAEAQEENRAVCAAEGHTMSEPYCSADCNQADHPECFASRYCLRCGVKERELAAQGAGR